MPATLVIPDIHNDIDRANAYIAKLAGRYDRIVLLGDIVDTLRKPGIAARAYLVVIEARRRFADNLPHVAEDLNAVFLCLGQFGSDSEAGGNGVNSQTDQISRHASPHLEGRVPSSHEENLMGLRT